MQCSGDGGMLPTTIRPGGPSLSVSSAVATASQPSPHHPRINDRASGTDALQSQERAVASDPKYRKYAQQVEKTLATFEHVNEWADFITFLAKLLKCLQSAPQYPFIPHKLTVAKRLSQCLNPALPTGVHQRALDVYVHILTTIGPDNLRRDLPAWTSGLLPFFQYAATSIKPMVLSIFSRFYLPLQEALRPATKAFILALLPGLDEEASEWFEQASVRSGGGGDWRGYADLNVFLDDAGRYLAGPPVRHRLADLFPAQYLARAHHDSPRTCVGAQLPPATPAPPRPFGLERHGIARDGSRRRTATGDRRLGREERRPRHWSDGTRLRGGS